MAIKYTSTKPEKEKPQKAPKAPKTEKPAKKDNLVKVKMSKPTKAAKAPKAQKPQKVKNSTPAKAPKAGASVTFKGGKTKKTSNTVNGDAPKKAFAPKIAIVIGVILVLAIVMVAVFLIMPAVKQNGEAIKEISVSQLPDKTVYLTGEEANYTGLRIQVTKKNGETYTVRAHECEITGFDSAKEGYIRILVKYEGFEVGFNLKVQEPPRPTPSLKSISLKTLPKTEYKVGERLDTIGGVILCEYNDGSQHTVSLVNGHVSGFKNVDGPGTYMLTVKYKENGVLATCTYEITVTE